MARHDIAVRSRSDTASVAFEQRDVQRFLEALEEGGGCGL